MKNIVNIINFVRQNEPREGRNIDLLGTTRNQIEHMRRHGLTGTFLLQYDALIDPAFTDLLKDSEFELGLWLEIVQPQVEAVGGTWRGRYPWDWFNDVGFLIGYEPEMRLRLIDEAMRKFEEIFGYLPKSAGSWHMDAVSLEYMSSQYGMDSFCICRDQVGTDGYTMQGGYYNHAYYPSKNNMFAPAGSWDMQINTPVFRMLGSDPIYAYDYQVCREDYHIDSVPSLECVHATGSNPLWVKTYFENIFLGSGISFQYTQAGQENSFGWDHMCKGFTEQMEYIRKCADEGMVEVMTLGDAGRWFKSQFDDTPPSLYPAMTDVYFDRYKSVWYSSKAYRANLFWDEGVVRFRDMYIFTDELKEHYLTKRCATHACEFRNLPVIDGALYGVHSGVYLTKQEQKIVWQDICCSETADSAIIELSGGAGTAKITLAPTGIRIDSDIDGLALTVSVDPEKVAGRLTGASDTFANHNNRETVLSFITGASAEPKRVQFTFCGVRYGLTAKQGQFTDSFCILPENGRIELEINA